MFKNAFSHFQYLYLPDIVAGIFANINMEMAHNRQTLKHKILFSSEKLN